ncbi:MAG TPA: lipid A-modifier LpxR family protein [Puia sp.]|nr:lipid A-modifier LpxR family protein [Puia sp.]
MNRSLLILFFLSGLTLVTVRPMAQYRATTYKDSVTSLLRVSEDNDGINIFFQSTDDAYTNGTRLDYFYKPGRRLHGLLGRWAPGAGEGSVDIYSWGLMQLMYTPNDMSQTVYQPNDYPYSGALVATHTRYSYNPVKKYDLQTEVVMGALGPLSLAHQTQSLVHRLTGFNQPMGWGTQFHNALLLNVNLTAEKQIAAAGQFLRIIGGGQVYAGTMQNGVAIYPLILIGKMNPYFDGLFSQYTSPGRDERGRKKWQFYFLAKPELQFYLTNALLEGGIFTTNPNKKSSDNKNIPQPVSTGYSQQPPPPPPPSIPSLQRLVSSFSYGGVLSHGGFAISFVQNVSSTTLKGLYCHDFGNVSLYFGW